MLEANPLNDDALLEVTGGTAAATYFTCSTCGAIVNETTDTVTESGFVYQARYKCPNCKTYFFDVNTYSDIWYQTHSVAVFDKIWRSISSLGTTNVGTF